MRRAEPAPPHFLARSVVVDGARMPFQVFVPAHYRANSGGRLPIVLFLHGSGERGDDGKSQLGVGLGPAVRAQADTFPAIVVFPQAARGAVWAGAQARAAMAALDVACAEWNPDPERVYLTGISMGGYGTWQLALDDPDRFAALVPICGGVSPPPRNPAIHVHGIPADVADPYGYVASRTVAIPTWIFHGRDDDAVPVGESRAMARALEIVGGDVRYTEYPGVRHNCWDAAYGTLAVWEWLFAQRR